MKKMFLLAALMTAAIMQATDVVETTVFSVVGNENKTVTEEGITNGSPAVTFTYSQSVLQGSAPVAPSFHSTNYISVNGKYSTSSPTPSGRNMMMGDLSGYSAPFNQVLHNIDADSVVWTFNMRSSDTNGANGLGRGKRSTAAVLAMDNSDLLSGNGYAVINKKTTSNKAVYELVRVTGGLDTVLNITSLISYTATKRGPYMVFKIVYMPATDKWEMFCADLSAGETTADKWLDPTTVEMEKAGDAIDNTFTGNTMTTFGFYNGYYGLSTYYNLNVRNYKVRTFKTDVPTPDPEPEYKPSTLAMPNMDIYTGSFTAQNATELADMRYGTPKVLWTNTKYTYGTAAECVTPSMQAELNVPGLKAADSKGRNILTAPTALFGMPWESKLSECAADSIVWMFNMRYNYDWTNGFNDGQRGIAAVLAMDGADMLTANGYAIVNNATYYYKLVRFDGGLNDNDKVTELCSTVKIQLLSDSTKFTNKRYMTFRVIYVPSTNTWKMYYAGNTSSGAYQKPDESTIWNLADSVVDATHTSKEMTYFGFMNNYLQGASFDASLYIKNYSIGAFTSGVTSISLDEGKHNGHMLEALDGETVDVRMERVLHGGSWNTLCVPFDMSSEEIAGAWGEGVELAIFSGAVMESGALVLEFDDTVTAIEAGKPYLIKPGADVTGATVLSNRVISKSAETINAAPVKMTGVLSPTVLKAGANTLYLGANNTLYQVEAGSDPLPGMRAYFTLNDEVAGAPAFRLRVGNHGTPTGMDNIERDNAQCTKVIRDGHIVIIREGKEYSIVGQ